VFSARSGFAGLRGGAERDLREYADVEALELFANDVDVVTYEFENVPAATAMVLAARRPVLPAQKILETTQDRLIEKDFISKLGIGTADYADVSSVGTLRAAIERIGLPAVVKTRRFGYDGKGQAIIREGDDLEQIWRTSAPSRQSSRLSCRSSARSR